MKARAPAVEMATAGGLAARIEGSSSSSGEARELWGFEIPRGDCEITTDGIYSGITGRATLCASVFGRALCAPCCVCSTWYKNTRSNDSGTIVPKYHYTIVLIVLYYGNIEKTLVLEMAFSVDFRLRLWDMTLEDMDLEVEDHFVDDLASFLGLGKNQVQLQSHRNTEKKAATIRYHSNNLALSFFAHS